MGLSDQRTVVTLREIGQLKDRFQGEGRLPFKTVKSEIGLGHFTVLCVLSIKKVMVSLNYCLLSDWIVTILHRRSPELEER